MASHTTSNIRPCKGTNRDGTPCSAPAITGVEYCYWHDPARAARRAEANRRGGRNRSHEARAKKLLRKGVETLGDVREVLLVALIEVYEGDLDPKVANAMANLATKITALEIGLELAEQVAELRRQFSQLSERVG